MKRFALAVLFVLLATAAYAAENCTTGVLDPLGVKSGKYEMLVTCTAATDGTLSVTLDDGTMDNLDGRFVYLVTVYPGSPAMTDGSELEIRDSIERVIVDNNDNGNDLIDSVSTTYAYTQGPNGDHFWIGNDSYAWTVYVENNSVNGGKVNLLFTLVDDWKEL